eukprot:1707583-Pyramimonas_sp.AAC.1
MVAPPIPQTICVQTRSHSQHAVVRKWLHGVVETYREDWPTWAKQVLSRTRLLTKPLPPCRRKFANVQQVAK